MRKNNSKCFVFIRYVIMLYDREKRIQNNSLVCAPNYLWRLTVLYGYRKSRFIREYLEEYMKYATEVGEVSLRTEPGVLTMYAVSEKENPGRITILETYASQEAYKSHIASEHFQKYKQGTLHMVKTLVLSDQTPLNPANCINNFIQ